MDAGGVPVTGDEGFRDPRWRWPEYDRGAVLELRVHGVGGEGPEGMTRDDHPVLVGGDSDVGFWRARRPLTVDDADAPAADDVDAPAAGHGPSDPPARGDAPRRVREVVSWGGSTSGHRRSAWWVVLLPFALFNAAGRMAPGDASPRRHETHQVVCRLLGLSLTLSVVGIASGIALDLLAIQCAASVPCTTAPLTGGWLLAPLRWSGDDVASLLAVLALIPLAVPYLLRVAARRQLARKPPLADPGPAHHRTRAARRLDDPDAWHNTWPAWRLRGLHVTAGYSWVLLVLGLLLPVALPDGHAVLRLLAPVAVVTLVATAVLVALPRVAGSAHSRPYGAIILVVRWLTLVPLGLAIGVGLADRVDLRSTTLLAPALGVVAAAAFVWATREHLQHVTQRARGGSGPPGSVRDVALIAAVAVGGLLADLDGATHRTAEELAAALPQPGALLEPLLGGLPGAVYLPVWALVAIQSVLLIALVATSGGSGTERTSRGRLPPVTTVPGNLTAPALALVTMLLTAAIGAGVHGLTLDWLGTRVTTADEVAAPAVEIVATDDGMVEAEDAAAAIEEVAAANPRASVGLVLPWWYVLTAVVVLATVVVFAVAALGLDRWLRWRASPPDDVVRDALGRSIAGLPVDDDLDAARVETVGQVVDGATRQWLHQGLVRRAGAALFVVEAVVMAGLFGLVAVTGLTRLPTADIPFDTVALALVAAIPPASVALLRAAREDRIVRRQIGALWDVLCFWPRVTHPFSPPSYGEAVVPAVVERINRYPADSTVVLAGHSQGSVIALAAVLSPALDPRRLHLVTYGSPVSLLYEGFFPSVFGGDEGAIARATPGDEAGGPSPLVTWHNVLSITEPISTPLWGWSPAGSPAPDDQFGWPLRLRLPWVACPACGWVRPDRPDVDEPTVTHRAVDVTITDPDRVLSPSVEVDGRAAGHSSYHRSRELDQHLASLS